MLNLRRATIADHKFLVHIDLKDEGISSIIQHEEKEHSEKILKYLTDQAKGAFIIEDTDTGKQIGMIMYTIANRDLVYPWKTIFNEIDRTLFQSDGRFMEIFQLWIHSNYRRLGLATKLKLKLEEEAQCHKVSLIYTHTEETNNHVIELNKKIGYQEVRCGPIWDDVIRVSLIKQLN
jgi:ribosomal protein S18 acetylase RimI-like enzyme